MTHEEKVKAVCKQVQARRGLGTPIKLKKASVSHFVPNPNDESHKLPKIDLSGLSNILEINAQDNTCIAEPGVTFADLARQTLHHGLIPMTVPELKTITLGGAISGCSIESMSYKLGGFHDSCIEYEIVTGTGNILNCSEQRNSDIFEMIHGSYGTLGILTKIKFKLIPAKPFVKMTYVNFDNIKDYWAYMQERCTKDDYDFIDGIIHSPKQFTVCLGTMVDEAKKVSSYTWLNMFYKSTATLKDDYLTTFDYFFRYDTECHWLTKTVPLLETKPARLLLGKLVLGSTNLIKWSKRVRYFLKLKKRPDVVVDVFIPYKRFEEFYNWYEKEFKFFPLWIVPYKAPKPYPWIGKDHAKGQEDGFFIDCAVYGKLNNEPDVDYSEVLEKKTIELGGIKTLISRNHFDEETFWKVYNLENYQSIKRKTDPSNLFNNLYKKFHSAEQR